MEICERFTSKRNCLICIYQMVKSKDISSSKMETYTVLINGHEVGCVSATSIHEAEEKAAQTYHASILNIHVTSRKYKL